MSGMGWLKRWTRHLAAQVTKKLSRTMILLYHRVMSLPSDPQKLCVSPENFDAHLRLLRRHFHPISLQQLCNDLRNGQISNRGIVVTFDDGYADNLFHAKPILEKYGVPATMFVVSDWIDSPREFYWDDLARILLTTPELPDRLEIKISGQTREWDLTDRKETPSAIDLSATPRRWDVEVKDNPTPRHLAYRELAPLLRDAETGERERALRELTDWAGINRDGRNDHRTLTAGELCALEDGGLLEVGAHTISHVRLSELSANAQKLEIFDSKQKLEALIGHPVTSFSYPFGGREDYNDTSIKLIREAGFACACSNFQASVHRWSDPFQLPRFLVRDWDGEEFERQLRRFFGS
jgi:peptidoglycan/xylan/chitin deacetylase (PgdA/CDA1 family)